MKTIQTKNETETIAVAKNLAKFVQPGMTFLLLGDLGAGKTTFTKGIGAGLGIKRIIKSPTYTIIREYTDGRLPLYHIDLYRLESEEVGDLALDEYFTGEGLSVIEWPTVSPEDLPKEYLEISLQPTLENLNQRTIQLKAYGQIYEQLLSAFNSIEKDA